MKRLLFVLAIVPFVSNSQDFDYLPNSLDSSKNQIVHHTYYSLSYSEEHEQPEWVAYELTDKKVNGTALRSNNFRLDKSILTGSSTLTDYRGQGYDRGHLVPSGDMKFDSIAMSESFLMSNISPQEPSFNRGIWKKLESQVRSWAVENKHIYIITGGILEPSLDNIGENRVSVPEEFYKIIFDYQEPDIKMIAFLIPNKKATKPLIQYTCSVDYLESICRIDFFPNLEEKLENKLESNKSSRDNWNWSSVDDKKVLEAEYLKTLNKYKR